jgi:hypothetical protein
MWHRGRGTHTRSQLGAKVDQRGSSAPQAGVVQRLILMHCHHLRKESQKIQTHSHTATHAQSSHFRRCLPAYGRPTHADERQRTGHYVAGSIGTAHSASCLACSSTCRRSAQGSQGGGGGPSVSAQRRSFVSASRSASAAAQSQRSDCIHHMRGAGGAR